MADTFNDEARQIAAIPDASDEKNTIETVKEKELEVIDDKEVVARANLLGQREREQIAREQESLGNKAESKRIDVENLSEKALEQDDANNISERTGGTTDRDKQQHTEREKNRQVELMEQVHSQFRVSGAKFLFKDQPGKTAFKDKGERMVSSSNEDRVAKAMATMAEAKGWKTIKISGHPDFQREVWMEANLRGIETRGYKPTEQDLKLLEEKRDRAMHNTIEHDKTTQKRKPQAQRQEKVIVAEAIAAALIDSKVKDPTQREALKAAVAARMAEREKTNKVPAVPVYDKAARAKSQLPERTRPVVERNSERTR